MIIKDNNKAILFFLKHLWIDISLIIIYASIVATIDLYTFLKTIHIPLYITSIAGTIVGLLLAFRTAQSYERWWETRKVWGEIVNESRTLIRQVKQFFPDQDKGASVDEFAQRQVIWCFALSESLRKEPFSDKVKTYLGSKNITSINIPDKLLNKNSEHLASVWDFRA